MNRTTTFLASLALAALPAAAVAQEKPIEYIPTKLSDTVTMIQGRGGNIAVSAGADGVFIIDDQYQHLADQLLAAIGEVSDQPIRFVINTHYHGDHVGGNEAVGKGGAVIIAHDNIRKRMSSDQFNHFWNDTTPAWPDGALPVVTFNDRVTLHLNGEPVTAYHTPRGHTDGDAIIHFPHSDILHMGDVFFYGLYPFIDLDGGGTVQGLITAVELGLSLSGDATRVIPGHGPLTDKAGLQGYHDMLVAIRDSVQTMIDDGMSLQQVADAKPTAQWDEELGGAFIKPDQLVVFVYNSLVGVDHYTPLESSTTE
jgi:glyoxylase-like metal-dependent hydrolase (beta-lactamase superfamily II)